MTKVSWTRHVPAVLGVGFVAGVLRFYGIGDESIWLDEGYTFSRSTLGVPDLIENSRDKNHNPAYFLLMHAWLLLGDTEAMLRAPSAVAGTLTVMVTYGLGTLVGGPRAGLGAALVVALSPFQIKYGQEARMYALVTLWTTTAVTGFLWLALHPDEANRPWWRSVAALRRPVAGESRQAAAAWLAFIVGNCLAMYMHNTVALFIVAMNLAGAAVLIARWSSRRALLLNWITAYLLVGLLYLPWFPSLLGQTGRVADHFWKEFPSRSAAIDTIRDLYLFGHRDLWLNGAVLLLGVAGLWALRRRPLVAWLLGILAVSGPLLVLLVSLHTPIWLPRLMLWSPVFFAVLCGAGLAALRPTPVFVAVLAGFVAWSGMRLEPYYRKQTKPPWQQVAAFVRERAAPADVILAAENRTHQQLNYYMNRTSEPFGPRPVLRGKKGPRIPAGALRAQTLWLVAPYKPRRERGKHKDAVVARLTRQFGPAKRHSFNKRTDVYEFRRRAAASRSGTP